MSRGRVLALLVEDNPGDARLVREMLAETGAAVELAHVETLGAALRWLGDAGPDVVLLDLSLPDIDGLATLARLQAAAPEIPVIVLTGLNDAAMGLRAVREGAQDYLVKGRITGDALLRTMQYAIERRRIEQRLRDTERRWRTVLEHVRLFVVDLDGRGVVRYANPFFFTVTGYAHEDVIGVSWFDRFLSARDRGGARTRLLSSTVRDVHWYEETWIVTKAGDERRVAWNTTCLRDRDGMLAGAALIGEDVTERARMHEALRASEARLSGILDMAEDGIISVDAPGRIRLFNKGAEKMFGYAASEVLGHPLDILVPSRLRDAQRHGFEVLTSAVEGGSSLRSRAVTGRRRDGSEFPAELSLSMLVSGGEMLHTAIVRDVSERHEREETLRRQREALYQNEKLAAMGELLAGVAHELNNPLAVVIGRAEMIRRKIDPGALAESAEKLRLSAERCVRIVRNFLAMARQHPPERRRVELERSIREALELLAYQLRVNGIDVSTAFPPATPTLWADPHELHQVFVNLIGNACHAMRQVTGPRRLAISVTDERPLVRVTVADTGTGIPPEVLPRVFEPFFTTKPVGEGTGLGLALCRGILERHGGRITVDSEPGSGAVFTLELPLGTPPETASALEDGRASAPAARQAILVVDDEPEIAALLAEILASDGHDVDTVPNGALAMERLRRKTYDVVLSDVKMPVLDGPGLYAELARVHPQLLDRIVFLTGDVLTSGTLAFLQQTRAPVLRKPFGPDDVRRVLRRLPVDR